MKELVALLRISVSGLHRRLPMSLVVIVSVASVVVVFVSMLATTAGLNRLSQTGARDDRAIVLSRGANSEMRSQLGPDSVRIISSAAAIRRSEGRALASAEVVTLVSLPRNKGGEGNVILRGIDAVRYSLSADLDVVRGRRPAPGARELMAGMAAVRQFSHLDVGDKVSFRGADWEVVGAFTAGGALLENTLIVDAPVLLSVLQATNRQSVTVVLSSPDAFADFERSLTSDPSLSVTVRRESDYLADISRSVTRLIDFVRDFVVTTMAIGAALAGIISMHAIVESRSGELAILRALGFTALAGFLSLVVEALLLAALGAALGAGAAYAYFEGRQVEAVGVDFSMRVTAIEIAWGICWAFALGLVGGALPAWRWMARPPRPAAHP